MDEILRLQDITKRFPDVIANDEISLSISVGEIRGIVGENGAGKTTLMRIIFGMYQPDSGQILYEGRPVDFHSPRDAMAAGIAMVHQHSLLVPSLTVTENVLLASPKGALLDRKAMAAELQEVMDQYGLDLDLDQPTGALGVAEKQRAEIIKALYAEADLIVLDEPTTVLTPQEADELFKSLRRLQQEGKTVIFITHKLPEVEKATDRVTVLRGGKVIATKETAEVTKSELAYLMVGRDVELSRRREFSDSETSDRSPVLELTNLRVADGKGHLRVKDVSLDVAPGEVLGIAAVQGNGQSELVEAIVGIREAQSGRVLFNDHDVTDLSIRRRRELGCHYIPREREAKGTNAFALVWENLIMGHHRTAPLSRWGALDLQAIHDFSQQQISDYDIVTPSQRVMAGNLSGGNLQKVVVARELAGDPLLVIAEEPTQGVDVGATRFVRDTLLEMRDSGVAVLLVSSSLDEVLELSDRIAVLYSGRVMGVLPAARADERVLGRLMMGVEKKSSS